MHSIKLMINLLKLTRVSWKKDILPDCQSLTIHFVIKINNLQIDPTRIRIIKMILIGKMTIKKQKCQLKIR